MEGNYIFQVTPESFQADVVEQSKATPVLILFWADLMSVPFQAFRHECCSARP